MPPVEFKLSKIFDNTRRVSFPEPPSWAELATKIYELYDVPVRSVGVSYVDHDGDEITISSDQEIKDFYATSLVPGGTIKFTVRDLGNSNAPQAKELPDTPRMSAGTFGPGGGMPFMFSEIEDGWQRIPGLGFSVGQRPLSFASSDGPHAFVETIASDASVQAHEDRDDASSTMDTDLGEIIEPTIAVQKGKGKEVDRSSLRDFDTAMSVLADERPEKIPIHAMPVPKAASVSSSRVMSPQPTPSEVTAAPTAVTPKPAPDDPVSQPPVMPILESAAEATNPNPSTSSASLYNDIANLLTTAASIFAQHPELSESLRNIVNNATNGTYLNGAPEAIARVAEDFRHRAQEAQTSASQTATVVIDTVQEQAQTIRDAAEAQRAALMAQAEATREAAEAERAAHQARAEAMREAAEAERAAHQARAEGHRTAAEAMREAHRAGAEAHRGLREVHRAAAKAHRGAFAARRSAVQIHRAAEEEAGRRVADAVGNIFRAFVGPDGQSDGKGTPAASTADGASRPPFYSIPLRANESEDDRGTNPFRALGPAGAILNHFMPPGGGPQAQSSPGHAPSLRRQEHGRTNSQSRASRQSVATATPPVAPRQSVPSRPPHPPTPPAPPVAPAPPLPPVAPASPSPPRHVVPPSRAPVRPPASTAPPAAAPPAQARTAKEDLEEAKRRYKEAKEQYRRDREGRHRRSENVSGDSILRSASSQDPQNPATNSGSRQIPASAQPTPMTDTSALPSNASQVISTGRGRFPPLEMVSASDPRRTSLQANGSVRRSGTSQASTVTAGPSSPSVRVKRKLADMGFSDAVYPGLPSMIETHLAGNPKPSKSDEEEMVAKLLEELLAFSPPPNSRRPL